MSAHLILITKIPIDTVTLSIVLFKPTTLHIICLTGFQYFDTQRIGSGQTLKRL